MAWCSGNGIDHWRRVADLDMLDVLIPARSLLKLTYESGDREREVCFVSSVQEWKSQGGQLTARPSYSEERERVGTIRRVRVRTKILEDV
jgi:hypothetical protein